METNESEAAVPSGATPQSEAKRSLTEDITTAISASVVVNAIYLLWTLGLCGFRPSSFGAGVWLFISWMSLWTFLLLPGFVSVSLGIKRTTTLGPGLWAGSLLGLIYGWCTGHLGLGLVCGLFVGGGAGMIASNLGLTITGLATSQAMNTYGLVLFSFLSFVFLGLLKPIPLVRKVAPQSAVTATASAPTETTTTKADNPGTAYQDPDKQAVYEKGWDEGVMLAREWLNGIERKANGQPVKEYLKSNPSDKWNAEQQSDALMKQQLACASVVGGIYQSLVNRGILSDLNKHPDVVAAEQRNAFASGKMAGFNATFMPLLKD
jgi:hypothetical protein